MYVDIACFHHHGSRKVSWPEVENCCLVSGRWLDILGDFWACWLLYRSCIMYEQCMQLWPSQISTICSGCHTGHPSAIRDGDIKYISSLLTANPALYLDELQTQLATIRNLHILIATICHLLTRHQLTRKHLQKVAIEQNKELWGLWETNVVQYTDPEVFIVLDKSTVETWRLELYPCKTHYAQKWTVMNIVINLWSCCLWPWDKSGAWLSMGAWHGLGPSRSH